MEIIEAADKRDVGASRGWISFVLYGRDSSFNFHPINFLNEERRQNERRISDGSLNRLLFFLIASFIIHDVSRRNPELKEKKSHLFFTDLDKSPT